MPGSDSMKIHNVFDEIFYTWSHIAVLRALQDSAQGMTGREIARAADMTPMASLKALTALESVSVVSRQRSGRSHIFRLNRENILVKDGILPILRLEREFGKQMFKLLTKRTGKKCESIIVFGSVARQEDVPESDLDICFIVNGKANIESVRETVYETTPVIQEKFGAQVAPLFFTLREFKEKHKLTKSPVDEIVRDGIVISGKSLRELTRGTKNRS